MLLASCMHTEVRSHSAQAGIYIHCIKLVMLPTWPTASDEHPIRFIFFTDLYPSISTCVHMYIHSMYMHTHIHGHISLQKGITPCHMQLDV